MEAGRGLRLGESTVALLVMSASVNIAGRPSVETMSRDDYPDDYLGRGFSSPSLLAVCC